VSPSSATELAAGALNGSNRLTIELIELANPPLSGSSGPINHRSYNLPGSTRWPRKSRASSRQQPPGTTS
jgi:hypothetical protein